MKEWQCGKCKQWVDDGYSAHVHAPSFEVQYRDPCALGESVVDPPPIVLDYYYRMPTDPVRER